MMKYIGVILSFVLMMSCASSTDVVHKGFLQKRKYKKGYNLSLRKKKNEKTNSQESLVFHDDHDVEELKFVEKSKANKEPQPQYKKAKEEEVFLADLEVEYEVKTSIERAGELFVEEVGVEDVEEDPLLAIKQSRRMTVAQVSKIVGLVLIIPLITLPITYVLFLVSLHSLLMYTRDRKVEDKDSLYEREVKMLYESCVTKMKVMYILMAIGLGCFFSVVLLYDAFVVFGVLGLIALALFLANLLMLTIQYFKLFKMVRQKDMVRSVERSGE